MDSKINVLMEIEKLLEPLSDEDKGWVLKWAKINLAQRTREPGSEPPPQAREKAKPKTTVGDDSITMYAKKASEITDTGEVKVYAKEYIDKIRKKMGND